MIKEWLIRRAQARLPDFIVGGRDDPYLLRWWFIPRNRFFNIYIHHFMRSDDDRAHHDHPWLFRISWMMHHSYITHTIAAGGVDRPVRRETGDIEFCWGASPHRVELRGGSCWTLFITGPVVREWGFHCPTGWIPWQQFVSARDKGSIGRGCD
jgi:hypothetical protein